jgi:hypothetical protein
MNTNVSLKAKLKAELWSRFGHKDHPSEWDGNVYGGGKISQRFWEYFRGLDLLELTPESVLLDIGGGSPATGAGFFASMVAPFVKQVHVLDVSIGEDCRDDKNIIYHRQLATYDNILALFKKHPGITHVACLSVFEHIEQPVRVGIIRGVNDAFTGAIFVATLEYHTKKTFFESQLTAATLSELFSPFTNFYLEEIAKSPVWSEDAYFNAIPTLDGRRSSLKDRIGWYLRVLGLYKTPLEVPVPMWYPLALRFVRKV